MNYWGDFPEDSTVNIFWTTHYASGAPIAPASAFEASDLVIYKGSGAVEKTNASGINMISPLNAVVGLHSATIYTSEDNGDVGFWGVNNDYTVVLAPDETVDNQTVLAVIGQFSIENRYLTTTGIADATLGRDLNQVANPAERSPVNALRFLRNRWYVSGDLVVITQEDDITPAWSGVLTTTGSGNPIVGTDPV